MLRPPAIPPVPCLLTILAAQTCACAGPLASGQAEFDRGHYAAARQILIAMDHPGRWEVPERAGYLLYRGLTSGALGDVARARMWLREARVLDDTYPGCLAVDDEHRLRTALQTYEVAP